MRFETETKMDLCFQSQLTQPILKNSSKGMSHNNLASIYKGQMEAGLHQILGATLTQFQPGEGGQRQIMPNLN